MSRPSLNPPARPSGLANASSIGNPSDNSNGREQQEALAASGVQVETGGHQPATLAAADLVVVSPGVPVEQPAFAAARDRGVEIIGELELAWRWRRVRARIS